MPKTETDEPIHPVVGVSDAVVDPWAVVVHLLHAATALPAVVRTRNLEATTHLQPELGFNRQNSRPWLVVKQGS